MPITLSIKTTAGKVAQVRCRYDDKVVDLKNKIERQTSLGYIRELVCRKGRVLDDDAIIAELGLEQDDILIATIGTNSSTSHPTYTDSSQAPRAVDRTIAVDTSAAKSRKKCFQCGSALNLVEQNMPCRCQGVFCNHHRAYEQHECTVNHAMLARAQLTQQLYSTQEGSAKTTTGAASSQAQRAFVYTEFCNSHRHASSRQAHAALVMSVGAEWDGVGVPTWVKRMVLGITGSYCFCYMAHSRCSPSSTSSSPASAPVFCVWSRNMATHPWQCLVCEARNMMRVMVDLVTNNRRNSLTPYLHSFKSSYDPLQ